MTRSVPEGDDDQACAVYRGYQCQCGTHGTHTYENERERSDKFCNQPSQVVSRNQLTHRINSSWFS